MEYHVVISESSVELITVVNQYLEKGWQLQGGVAACHAENDGYLNHVFAQAITRPTPRAADVPIARVKSWWLAQVARR